MKNTILPQQHLLLELLISSGDIAVEKNFGDNTLLVRTLKECEKAGWITIVNINEDYQKVRITRNGREQCGNRYYT